MPDLSEEKQRLEDEPGVQGIRKNVPLAGLTTFNIGGPADLFIEARSAGELSACVQAARRLDIPFFLLGLGANILIGDLGIRGLVIHNLAENWKIDRTLKLLHCENIVSDNSDGLWLANKRVTPYLRPSFAIRSIEFLDALNLTKSLLGTYL